MKIAVVGAGAMGSLFGALLAEAGNEVWLYDVWVEHVQTINRNGLSIEREGKLRQVKIKATADPEQINRAELVIIFVKSTQTQSAAKTAQYLTGSEGSVMTLQNGMGNADTISEFIEPVRILAGTPSSPTFPCAERARRSSAATFFRVAGRVQTHLCKPQPGRLPSPLACTCMW